MGVGMGSWIGTYSARVETAVVMIKRSQICCGTASTLPALTFGGASILTFRSRGTLRRRAGSAPLS